MCLVDQLPCGPVLTLALLYKVQDPLSALFFTSYVESVFSDQVMILK